jgi:hypothetical protein
MKERHTPLIAEDEAMTSAEQRAAFRREIERILGEITFSGGRLCGVQELSEGRAATLKPCSSLKRSSVPRSNVGYSVFNSSPNRNSIGSELFL